VHARLLATVFVALTLACSGRSSGPGSRPSADEHYQRCNTSSDNSRPLLVEWPSTQRGELEAELGRRDSLVVVRYTGCELEVLRGCKLEGHYSWTGISAKRDELEIRNAGDVWANIPLAAARLVTAVERYGALHLDMQLIGQYSGTDHAPARERLAGRCDEATHVIGSFMVGAFEISSAAGGAFRAGAEVYGAGAGVGASRHEGYFSSDGDLDSCSDRYGSGSAPPDSCKSLLQIELLLLPAAQAKTRGVCPADMAFVEDSDDSGFCLDLHEVTVGEYAGCAADHTCSEAPASVEWPGISDAEHELYDELCNTNRGSQRNHPVNCVTWDQSASYCRAQGKRLPTAMEWRWAARGGEQNRTYPWGEDRPGPAHVNACGKECGKRFEARAQAYGKSDGNFSTAPVGSYRAGIGRWGLLDLSGNVAEWTNRDERSWGNVWVVGGSALSGSAEELESVAGEWVDPSARRFDLGFRCASEPIEAGDQKRRRR